MIASMRRLALGIALSTSVAACSLFTDLGSLTSGSDRNDPTGDGSSSEAAPTGDGSTSDAASDGANPNLDGGSDAPPDARPLTYAETVLADGPLSYWRLDDKAAQPASALGSQNNKGTYTTAVPGAPGLIFGDTNTAATFDGTNSGVHMGDIFAFTGDTPYSVEAWIKPTLIDAEFRGILGRKDGLLQKGYSFWVSTNGGLGFGRYDDTLVNEAMANIAPLDVVTHVVGTFDGTNLRLYANGTLAATTPVTFALPANSARFAIGGKGEGQAGFFAGVIDEVAVYGKALEGTRIRAHYEAGKSP